MGSEVRRLRYRSSLYAHFQTPDHQSPVEHLFFGITALLPQKPYSNRDLVSYLGIELETAVEKNKKKSNIIGLIMK